MLNQQSGSTFWAQGWRKSQTCLPSQASNKIYAAYNRDPRKLKTTKISSDNGTKVKWVKARMRQRIPRCHLRGNCWLAQASKKQSIWVGTTKSSNRNRSPRNVCKICLSCFSSNTWMWFSSCRHCLTDTLRLTRYLKKRWRYLRTGVRLVSVSRWTRESLHLCLPLQNEPIQTMSNSSGKGPERGLKMDLRNNFRSDLTPKC